MKKNLCLLIIFIILAINLNGQSFESFFYTNTPCDEGYKRDTMFAVTYHELEEIYSNLNREINLFEGIDFENEPYEIVYSQHRNGENYYYHISDKNKLLQLKRDDYLNTPLFEKSEECISERFKVQVILKDKTIERFEISEKCGFVDTKCKKFQYSSKELINSGKQCYYRDKKITNDVEFEKYIEEINQDSNLIHYSVFDYLEGFFQFEYIDSSYQVEKILDDEFKVNALIQKEIERHYLNESIIKEELEEKGREHVARRLILEEILNWEYRYIEEVKHSPSEKPSCIVSVKYFDFPEGSLKKNEVNNLIISWERTTYHVSSYWKIEE